MVRKASDGSAADWLYQTHVKNCYHGFSQGWKSLYKIISLYDEIHYYVKEITYSMALAMAFITAENENQQLEDLPRANFGLWLRSPLY